MDDTTTLADADEATTPGSSATEAPAGPVEDELVEEELLVEEVSIDGMCGVY